MTAERFLCGHDAAGLAVFLQVALVGAASHAARVTVSSLESDTLLYGWLPLIIGGDLVVGAMAFALWRLVRLAAPERFRGVASGTALLTAGMMALAHAANLVSYRTTDSWITWARLRGGDAVTVKDFGLLSLPDALIGITALLFSIVAIPLLMRVSRRVSPPMRVRAIVVLLVAAFVLEGVYLLFFVRASHHLGEQPVLVFLDSLQPEKSKRRVRGTYPPVETPELWAEIMTPETTTAVPETVPMHAPATIKNVVLVLAESVSFKHSSFGTVGLDTTPNLKRRAQEHGLLMTRWYSPLALSIQAIYSVVCSDWGDPSGRSITETNPRIDCGEMSQVLSEANVRSGLFHAGNFGFYDKLALLGGRDWEVPLDAQLLSDPARWHETSWGIDDRAMVAAALDWIDSVPTDERFAATLISLSAHYPFELPPGVARAIPGKGKTANYQNTIHFLDATFEELMRGLEQRGRADDTLVIFVGDHGEAHGEQPHETPGHRVFYETEIRVPMVMLNPRLFPKGVTSDRLAEHVDLLPTVLDVLGLPADARHHGTSVFSPEWQPRRAFVGGKNDLASYVGFIDGDLKYILAMNTGEEEVYNLATDPREMHNIRGKFVERNEKWRNQTIAYYDWQMARIKNAKTLGDDIDMHERVMEEAEFSAIDTDGTAYPCTQTPPVIANGVSTWTCGPLGTDLFQGRQTRNVGGWRDCLLVQLDAGQSFRMEVRDAPYFSLLSRIRARFASRPVERKGSMEATVVVDGDDVRSAELRAGHSTRMSFPAPKTSWQATFSAHEDTRRICLTLTEKAWRVRKPAAPPVVPAESTEAAAIPAATPLSAPPAPATP